MGSAMGRPIDPNADPDLRVLLVGQGGLWEGLRKVIKPGVSVTIGRSRGCDVSLRRSPGFVDCDDATSVFHSEMFRKVSRVHCELELQVDGALRVRDLSRNGLLVAGVRVLDTYLIPADEDNIVLQLGDETVGVIEMIRKRA